MRLGALDPATSTYPHLGVNVSLQELLIIHEVDPQGCLRSPTGFRHTSIEGRAIFAKCKA